MEDGPIGPSSTVMSGNAEGLSRSQAASVEARLGDS
jgi:hypothetical protein